MSTTDCHRYLSRFVGISADTLDILVQNGVDSLNTLRLIDMDIDWNHLPPQISFGQKLLLRKALAKLVDVTDDDDYNDDRQVMAISSSIEPDSSEVTSSDSQPELKTQVVVEISPQRIQINDLNTNSVDNCVDTTKGSLVCSYFGCNKSFKKRNSFIRHQTCYHSTDRQFVCNYNDCNKSFKWPQTLCRHQKNIHGK
ncbi:uncharacterized protein LOC128952439 [Oppia nitens]|uniref:uncharacterized protein LOC128952439 n=1 Tax=Oppia nitens TaxID=1686743 RepID=UPI0023DB9D93|nr:uncharacterized protein LOC128952439 [Oppia nitens]